VTGDEVLVDQVGGVPNATGVWTVTVVGPGIIDLQESGFGGAYTSGGWITRVLHVTGAVDNGSGLVRLTVASHGYESGDRVHVESVGGVPNATGQWTVTVVDADHIDLEGSVFAGAHSGGGVCIRFFAGGLFQNIAIGKSFDNYSLRAFPDGSLKIHNAEIVLDGTEATITLDPDEGMISVVGKNLFDVVVEIASGVDPLSGFPSGLFVRRGSDPSDTYGAIGYQGLTLYSGGLPTVLLGSVASGLRMYDPWGVESVSISMTGNETLAGDMEAYRYVVDGQIVISHARVGNFEGLSIGGVEVINPFRQGTFVSVDSGTFLVGGVPGIGGPQNIVTAVTPTVATINYKDHAGLNASMNVVTGVAVTTVTRTFSSGLLTG
jgi:hypothetical protein